MPPPPGASERRVDPPFAGDAGQDTHAAILELDTRARDEVVDRAGHGGSEEEAVAALLHDAVEDAGGQRRLDDIAHRFGSRVASIVAGCSEWIQQPDQSDDDKPSWCIRKRESLEHLREETDESTLRVALADKVHNARAIVADLRTHGPEMATRFNAGASDQIWYYQALAAAFAERTPTRLRRELQAAVAQMRELIGELPRRAVVVGVDGAPYGWVAVAVGEDCLATVARFRGFREVLDAFADAEIVAVDIPVGLAARGLRAPDRAAKAFLGPHASRVFETGPRPVLTGLTYAVALARLRAEEGRGFSAQGYALRDKSFEVDECVAEDSRIREVHPEVSFRSMAGRPVAPKKSPPGAKHRLSLLERGGVWLPPDAFTLPGVGADDTLDAGAAAWSARRIANGEAKTLPETPDRDEQGREIAIWY